MLQISNEIEDMLLAQQTRYKIPAGLPEGVLINEVGGISDALRRLYTMIAAQKAE